MQKWSLMNVVEMEITLFVQHIPRNLTRDQVMDWIDAAGYGDSYDFLYVPRCLDTGANKGYMFINFMRAEAARDFVKEMDRLGLGQDGPSLSASLSETQGLERILAKCQRSCLRRVRNPQALPYVRRACGPPGPAGPPRAGRAGAAGDAAEASARAWGCALGGGGAWMARAPPGLEAEGAARAPPGLEPPPQRGRAPAAAPSSARWAEPLRLVEAEVPRGPPGVWAQAAQGTIAGSGPKEGTGPEQRPAGASRPPGLFRAGGAARCPRGARAAARGAEQEFPAWATHGIPRGPGATPQRVSL